MKSAGTPGHKEAPCPKEQDAHEKKIYERETPEN